MLHPDSIVSAMQKHTDLNTVVALEVTSIYSIHIADFFSYYEKLIPYQPYVFCLNPKITANYRKSFIGMNTTALLDTFVIADFASVGHIETDPWRGFQFLALQRLTRHMKNHVPEYRDFYNINTMKHLTQKSTPTDIP